MAYAPKKQALQLSGPSICHLPDAIGKRARFWSLWRALHNSHYEKSPVMKSPEVASARIGSHSGSPARPPLFSFS